MISSEAWRYYKENTTDASNFSRQLAYANAGVCWFFKSKEIIFPYHINFALLFLVFFFILDVSQYLLTSYIYRVWIKKCVRKYPEFEDDKIDVDQPAWLNAPSRYILYAKVFILFISYGFIAAELISRISAPI